MEVKRHRVEGDAVIIELWQAMAMAVSPDDTFVVTAGCDKRFSTCRDRFDNVLNFRGFPHIPGNDFLMRYALDGEAGHDGKSLKKTLIHGSSHAHHTRHHHRRSAKLDRHAVSASGLAQGRRLRLPRSRAWRLARTAWRGARTHAGLFARLGGSFGTRNAGRSRQRHLLPVAREAMQGGDVLLFRWRTGLAAKHAAILADNGTMIHAHDGAAVAEVAFAPWWRRRLAFAFRFPGVK